MINVCIKFLAIYFIFSLSLFAQEQIRFNHLTVEDGLSQSAVTCIIQDRKGFMWFGTQDGLNRYDGYNFKTFKNDPADSTSISDNFIFSIYENADGSLFFETQNGILNKYFPLTESFRKVDKNSVNLSQAKISSVDAVYHDSSKVKWSGGLGAATGLKKEDLATGKVTVYKHSASDPFSISDDKVYSIFRDHANNLWIGTFNGLDRLDEKTGKFYHYKKNASDPNSLTDNWIWPIFEDSKNNLWIGTVRGGLCKFNYETNSFTSYKNDSADPYSINDNFIFSIYEDRGGVMWVGTNTGGVNYFHPATQVFEHYTNKRGNKNSLSRDEVLSLYADSKGYYWIGTRGGGLDKFDYNKKEFKNYSNNPNNLNSVAENSVQLIYEDRSGILWLGTFSGGLDAFDPKTETFTHYTHNPSDSNSITDNRIVSIFEDTENILWIGTYGGGLNKFDKLKNNFSCYSANKNDSTALSSNSAWTISEDNAGNLWVGAFGGGVNVFDKINKTFTHFTNNPHDTESLSDDNVIRIFKDSNGIMWIGTTRGLNKFIPKTKKFKSYREKDGLANDFIYGILEDDKKNLWISTNNGISKFNPSKESFKNYYYNDGLQGNEFNQNAFAKDFKTGRLLFGGANGFNIFNPESLKENIFLPPIVFTNYIRYNTDDKEGKPINEKGIDERENLSLSYKDNIVIIDFAALSYLNNSENQYRYKLEKINKNWIQLGTNHTVTFTNLSPGNYTLRIAGSNNDGLWNEQGAALAITVSPPWWKTKFAYLIYAVVFLSALYGIRKYEINRREQKTQIRVSALRIKAKEAENKVLEIENERKTKELEEARQLQLSMLPRVLPDLPNLEIAAYMRTATEVGGDYYDFLVQEGGVLNIAFGDATGHGLQAGTMVTLMKGFFTSDSAKLSLQEFMNHCSRIIKEIKLGRILMSFCYAKIDKHKLYLTSAGMPPVYLFSNETKTAEEIIIHGMPLGAMKKFSYGLIEKELNSGDVILFLTDGLPEQMNSNEEMFDYIRVRENFSQFANESPQRIIDKLIAKGDEWMDGAVQADDISFVVVKVK